MLDLHCWKKFWIILFLRRESMHLFLFGRSRISDLQKWGKVMNIIKVKF